MPELINITDEQYKAFLEIAVVNTYGKDKLAQVIAKGAKAPTGAGAKPQSETSLKSPLESDQQSTPSKSTATTTQTANPSQPPTKPTEAKPPTTTPQNSVKPEQSGNNGKSKQTTPPATNHSGSEGSGS